MATFRASSGSQLDSILKSVGSGDTILLEGGNYGSLDMHGKHQSNLDAPGTLTIASASGSNPAVFSDAVVKQVTNVVFDGVEFRDGPGSNSRLVAVDNSNGVTFRGVNFEGTSSGGHGSGHGLWVSDSRNINVLDSDFSDLSTATWVRRVDDLEIVNSDYDNIALDAMILGNIHDGLIAGNDIDMNGRSGLHRDAIQFYNLDGPSSDITIRNNVIEAPETTTHGINFGNERGSRGNRSEFHEDILIENNTIRSGQTMGIAVAESDGVDVRGNVVLQHGAVDSGRGVNIPVIVVQHESTDVTISGNTTHKTPYAATTNWQFTPSGGSGWNLSNNNVVSLGTSGPSAPDRPDPEPVDRDPVPAPEGPSEREPEVDPGSEPEVGSGGDGDADFFRFKGDNDNRSKTLGDLSFADGDRILLNLFDRGTFEDERGGNSLKNSSDGIFVEIDSLTDLQELAASSDAVTARVSSNALILEIDQESGTHALVLPDYGREYAETFDSALF